MGPDRLRSAPPPPSRASACWCSTSTSWTAPASRRSRNSPPRSREFRASGKKVIAYGTYLPRSAYYLAAQADEIYLDPLGFVLLDGYDRYRMYFKDALDKLGVDINVFRVGEFKSAVETYTRHDMSPEDREESHAYLGRCGAATCRRWPAARNLQSPMRSSQYADSYVDAVAAAGGDAAKVAKDSGLVTGLKTAQQVESA